mgnify:FL=1
MTLKDYFGRELENGIYFVLDPIGPQIAYVELDKNKESFSAESWNGFLPINNFEEAAKNFVQIHGADTLNTNVRFIQSKLERLSKK